MKSFKGLRQFGNTIKGNLSALKGRKDKFKGVIIDEKEISVDRD